VQFLRVIELEPMNPRGYIGAAKAYIGLEQEDKAIEILEIGYERTGDDEIKRMLDELILFPEPEPLVTTTTPQTTTPPPTTTTPAITTIPPETTTSSPVTTIPITTTTSPATTTAPPATTTTTPQTTTTPVTTITTPVITTTTPTLSPDETILNAGQTFEFINTTTGWESIRFSNLTGTFDWVIYDRNETFINSGVADSRSISTLGGNQRIIITMNTNSTMTVNAPRVNFTVIEASETALLSTSLTAGKTFEFSNTGITTTGSAAGWVFLLISDRTGTFDWIKYDNGGNVRDSGSSAENIPASAALNGGQRITIMMNSDSSMTIHAPRINFTVKEI
jgi:hypothetical protein